jgi:hypothetical protein
MTDPTLVLARLAIEGEMNARRCTECFELPMNCICTPGKAAMAVDNLARMSAEDVAALQEDIDTGEIPMTDEERAEFRVRTARFGLGASQA